MRQPRIDRGDHHDADGKVGQVLLMLKALIRCDQHVERFRGAPQQLSILNRRPTFLLNRANRELRQIAPELARHVLIEENTSHAICASAARPAS